MKILKKMENLLAFELIILIFVLNCAKIVDIMTHFGLIRLI